MSTIKVLGIDLGKSSFHVIGLDSTDNPIFRKHFSRLKLLEYLAQLPVCIVAFEACGGAHWLARQCKTMGHRVRLIPPQYVKPYVQGNKNDFIDAAAIAEASTRPGMRFVPAKSESMQIMAMCHRLREGYVAERTACMSRIGAFLLEFGLSLPTGHSTMKRLFSWIGAQKRVSLPTSLLEELHKAHNHYLYLNEQIAEQDRKIVKQVEQDGRCQLLKTVPGIGDMTASQTAMEVGNAHAFKNGREMAAWLGLVPRQYSTGGKPKLLGISKRGNKRLRCLFVHGARAIMSRIATGRGPFYAWLRKLRASKPFNVVVVALANKLVRIAWSILRYSQPFDPARV